MHNSTITIVPKKLILKLCSGKHVHKIVTIMVKDPTSNKKNILIFFISFCYVKCVCVCVCMCVCACVCVCMCAFV